MSLLMFLQEQQSAVILTDTLATTTGGEPLIFQSKAWTIPHLNMGIAITGVANLGASWNDFLRSSLVARDINMVDQFAPQELRRIWSELLVDCGDEENLPNCTIYHFGFREGADQLVRYVYRSAKSFESELWEDPGFGMKPEPMGALEVPDGLDGWVALAERVRAEQDALSAEKKVYIGGELFMLVIRNWQSQIVRVHRFDDYEHVWLNMNAQLRR